MRQLSLVLLGLIVLVVALSVRQRESEARRDSTSREAFQRGREVYLQHCTGCHGTEADGQGHLRPLLPGTPPRDFTQPDVAEISADSLRKSVKYGGASRGLNPVMPAWEVALSDAEIEDVVTYVQTVSQLGYAAAELPLSF